MPQDQPQVGRGSWLNGFLVGVTLGACVGCLGGSALTFIGAITGLTALGSALNSSP